MKIIRDLLALYGHAARQCLIPCDAWTCQRAKYAVKRSTKWSFTVWTLSNIARLCGDHKGSLLEAYILYRYNHIDITMSQKWISTKKNNMHVHKVTSWRKQFCMVFNCVFSYAHGIGGVVMQSGAYVYIFLDRYITLVQVRLLLWGWHDDRW